MWEPSREAFERLIINAEEIFRASFPEKQLDTNELLYRAMVGDESSINGFRNPTRDNVDFLSLFAYNQLNSQAPANEFLYSNLVKSVLETYGTKTPDTLEAFFRNFSEVLDAQDLVLTNNTGPRSPNYAQQLVDCSKDAGAHAKAIIPQCIRRLYAFMKLFDLKYDGEASAYVERISNVPEGYSREEAAVSYSLELFNEKICGFAIACNFLKDVTANSFSHSEIDNRSLSQLYFLKPDLHLISAAVSLTCPPAESDEKANLKKLQGLSNQSKWLGGTLIYGSGQKEMKFRVLDIFYTWAKNANTTPFVLDRVIYMCKSGNTPYGKLVGSNEERNHKLFK